MINRDNFLKQKFSTGFIKKVEGEGVSFDNSIGAPFNSFNGDGKSTQETTNGNQLIDFASANGNTSPSTTSYTFENDILTVVGNAGSAYQYAAWYIKELFIGNEGKILKFKAKSSSATNQNTNSIVQVIIYYNDGSSNFYSALYNIASSSVINTLPIPGDISNIDRVTLGIYTNNSSSTEVENTVTIEEPLLYFDDNDTYEPYTGGQPSPSPDYPQQINSIGDNLEYVKTKLPSEYQEVEYIESTGTQYIDTGYKANNNSGIEIEVSDMAVTGQYVAIFGARENNLNQFWCFFTQNTHIIRARYNNQVSTGVPINNYTKINLDKNKLFVNDELKFEFEKQDFSCNYDIYLFCVNNLGSVQYLNNSVRIYSCKIYDNNNLVRDFVPCYRKSDNVIGMYDLANNIFYTNSGTGDFLKGADISDINLNIDLGEEKLRSIDDVKDELVIDMSTGDYYKVENIREVILNGTESWTANPRSVFTLIQDIGLKNFSVNDKPKITSNFFTTILNHTIYDEDAAITTYVPSATYNFPKIVIAYKEVSNLSEFQQWLSTHNTIVDYQLATPITKKIGTLSKEDLNKLSSFDGHNNIVVNTNLGLMNIRLEYRSKIN